MPAKKKSHVRDLKTKKDAKGGGKKRHGPTIGPIVITKPIDKSSPDLFIS